MASRVRSTRRRPTRVFVWFERMVLGFGMTVVAFFIERRLLKALKAGSVKPAPRTAASGDDEEAIAPESSQPRAEFSAGAP